MQQPVPRWVHGQRKAVGTTSFQFHHKSESKKKEGDLHGKEGSRVSNYFIPRLNFQDLRELSKPGKTPEDVVQRLRADLISFQHSLESSYQVKQSSDYVEVALCVLLKLCSATEDPAIQ